MSFPSATSYGEPNIYQRKVSEHSSGLHTPLFTSNKNIFPYGPDSHKQDFYSHRLAYSPQAFAGPSHRVNDCPVPDPYSSYFPLVQHNDSPSTSNVSHQTSYSISDDQSLENDIEYDEDDIQLKLQELETLLNDNHEKDQEVSMEDNWAEPMKDLSPNESSSESNISTVSSARETRSLKQLLFECAAAISEDSVEEASGMIAELRQMVSIQGDPAHRLAAYLVEGLVARMASSGRGIYKALKCKEPPSSYLLSAMQILFEVCPCFKFGFIAANAAIIDACNDEEMVHIIDFDINQGSQYITLMQDLSRQPNRPRRLRITGVDDPESVQRKVGGLRVIGQRLETLAEDLRLPLEFQAIAARIGDVTPSMLGCRAGEALIVNFAFQLHHMPDESVSTVNERDSLLRMVKSMKPKLVTVVEQDVNTNTAPFFPRFVEVYNYYSAIFESLDATISRENPDRMNVEKHCLAKEIVNVVACEGVDRIERYEAAGKWRARMTMAGFTSRPLGENVNSAIRSLLKSYGDKFKVKDEGGSLCFGWEDKFLIFASAWK